MKLKSAETDWFKSELLRRGQTVESFAVQCGPSPRTLRNAMALNFPSRRLRLKVENALNVAIWSSSEEYERRQRLCARYGFDPFTLPLDDFRKRAGVLKIKGRSACARRADLIAILDKHLNETRTPQKP